MTTIPAKSRSLNHGDAFLRELGYKYKIVVHNRLENKIIKFKVKSKIYDSFSSVNVSKFSLCFTKVRHPEDFPEEVFQVGPKSSYKVRLNSDTCIINAEIDGMDLLIDKTVNCSHDLVVEQDHLKLLMPKSETPFVEPVSIVLNNI